MKQRASQKHSTYITFYRLSHTRRRTSSLAPLS